MPRTSDKPHPKYCSELVARERIGVGQCGRRWTVERNGKKYCAQHDPDRVAEKRRLDQQREKLERVTVDAGYVLKDAQHLAVVAVMTGRPNELHHARTKLLDALHTFRAARGALEAAGFTLTSFAQDSLRGIIVPSVEVVP